MIRTLMNVISVLRNDERGQGMVEYGLILALVAVVAIVGLRALGVELDGLFDGIVNDLGTGN